MLKQRRWIVITLLAASALTGLFLRAYLGSFSDAFAFVRGERLLVCPPRTPSYNRCGQASFRPYPATSKTLG